jgi:TolA-binding protein
MKKMNMLGIKIDAQNLPCKLTAKSLTASYKASAFIAGAFLSLSSCVMTRNEADTLSAKMRRVEEEVAKLQRVRHDVEVLLSGQMRDLLDRIARLESQLSSLRESLYEGSNKSNEIMAELNNLRGQLEEAHFHYRALEQDQKTLAQKQIALKQAQTKLAIPPLKKDHLDLAKKLQESQKYEDALFLFEEYIKIYEESKDKDIIHAYFGLAEIFNKKGEEQKIPEDAHKLYKKAIIYYQKLSEQKSNLSLCEESLYKMGLLLKIIGNNKAAAAAFNELLILNKNSKRANLAKKQLSTLAASE